MKKRLFKLLAVFLSVLIAVMSFPLSAFATSINGTNRQRETQTSSKIQKDTYEIIELRDEFVKQFKQPDGTVIAVQYSDPVHYLDANGKWVDIDNTLSPSGNEFSIPNAKVKFAKKITGNESVFTLHSGNRKIEIGLINSVKKTAGKGVYYHVTSHQAAQQIADTGKLIPSPTEGSVCVLNFQPTLEQAKQLGSVAYDTVIQFKTTVTTFIADTTVPFSGAYRNMVNGAIKIFEIIEVGFK